MKNSFKSTNLPIFVFILIFNQITFTQSYTTKIDTPKIVENFSDYYQMGNFYLGGQPNEDFLEWCADNGVDVVINTRTEPEITKHTEGNFDEKKYVNELGMTYINIPLGGEDGYKPEAVKLLANAINNSEGKVLIHCTMGGRACHLFSAYLVEEQNYSVDDAMFIGKQMMLSFPFEKLLGYELTMKKKE